MKFWNYEKLEIEISARHFANAKTANIYIKLYIEKKTVLK